MSRKPDLQIKREQQIKEDFSRLKKPNKYTTDYILTKLTAKYFLTPRTLEAIIFGEYDRRREKQSSQPDNQMALFG
jgi:hypothetical protein